MRIVCQKCAAAYAIEEASVGPKGVRAQCPRCRHIQHVSADLASKAPAPAAGEVRCLTCGVVLEDLFDRALGVCESCRRRELAGPGPSAETTLPGTGPAPELAERRPPSGRHPVERRPSSGRYPAAVHNAALLPDAPPPGRGRWIVGAGAAVIVVLGALIAFMKPGLLGHRETAPRGLPAAIAEALPTWKLSFLDVSGSAADFLVEGDTRIALDTPDGYGQAAEAFQKALLLDPSSDAAIDGYVLAVALGRGTSVDEGTYLRAVALIEAAEERSHRNARALIAHAHLLLARPAVSGNVDRARALADEAGRVAQGDSQRAQALLASGRSYATTSSELARQQLDQAVALAPNLKRAYYYRALARAAAGEYQAAIADFQKRLASDPQAWEVLDALTALYAEVGDAARARSVWEHVPGDQTSELRARLPLAVLSYQMEGKADAAVADLTALLRARNMYPPRQLVELLAHLAAARRAAGDLTGAKVAGEEALSLAKDDPAAHLQLLLVALDEGAATVAAGHLPYVVDRLEDPALERVLEGRVLSAQGHHARATEAFASAVALDGRRVDARILAGVAAVRSGATAAGFKHLFEASQMDPTRLAPRPVLTRFYLQPGETLRGAEGHLLSAVKSEDDRATAKVDEALVLFHQGQWDRADALLAEALKRDENNGLAHALRAIVAMQRGAAALAKAEATQATVNARELPLARYALGMTLRASGDVDGAMQQLRDVLSHDASFLVAGYVLAQIELQRHDVPAAKERLAHLLSLDPSYLDVKRTLYALDTRSTR